MNYSTHSLDELVSMATLHVNSGWLNDESINTLRGCLNVIRTNAKTHKGDTYICPSPEDILAPFKLMTPAEVKVVITGQDPYPRIEDAVGIAFHAGGHKTASLENIKKCVENNGFKCTDKWSLEPWLKQGVLLTNVTLTCLEGNSNSHEIVWRDFIKTVLNKVPNTAVIMLWGRDARSRVSMFKSKLHVTAPHPTERGGTFVNSKCFEEANELLGERAIDWAV